MKRPKLFKSVIAPHIIARESLFPNLLIERMLNLHNLDHPIWIFIDHSPFQIDPNTIWALQSNEFLLLVLIVGGHVITNGLPLD